MNLLAIDTSTSRGSVAVLSGEHLVFAEDFVADRSHGSSLFTALERARRSVRRFEQIAVGLGPGSYAGVRISIAASIGLELVMHAALVGLPSVAAWETGCDRYIAVGDARRETYYWTRTHDGVCLEGPLLVTAPEFAKRLGEADLPVFAAEPLPGFANVTIARPSAALLARLTARDRGIVMRDRLEPIYLREPHVTQPKERSPNRSDPA